MKYIIDRFEGEWAVCETDGGMVNVALKELPKGVREGSVLRCDGGKWALDPQAEQARRARLHALQEDLFG